MSDAAAPADAGKADDGQSDAGKAEHTVVLTGEEIALLVQLVDLVVKSPAGGLPLARQMLPIVDKLEAAAKKAG